MSPRARRLATGVALLAALLAGLLWATTCTHSQRTDGSLAGPPPRTVDAAPGERSRSASSRPSALADDALDEVALMARLRTLVDPRPAEALRLARLGAHRFPAGRFADERSLLVMRALVHLNQIAAARDEAVLFFRRFPRSALAAQVSQLTGAHPRPRPGP